MKTAIRSAAWDKLIGSKEYRTECASVLFGTLSSFVSFPLVGQIGVNAKWHHGFCPKKLEKQPIFRRKRAVLELLGRFELPTSSLPTALEASIHCAARLSGAFRSKKDEVVACIFHSFRPLVFPCGSACGSRCRQVSRHTFPCLFIRQQWVKICTGVIKEKMEKGRMLFSDTKCNAL